MIERFPGCPHTTCRCAVETNSMIAELAKMGVQAGVVVTGSAIFLEAESASPVVNMSAVAQNKYSVGTRIANFFRGLFDAHKPATA